MRSDPNPNNILNPRCLISVWIVQAGLFCEVSNVRNFSFLLIHNSSPCNFHPLVLGTHLRLHKKTFYSSFSWKFYSICEGHYSILFSFFSFSVWWPQMSFVFSHYFLPSYRSFLHTFSFVIITLDLTLRTKLNTPGKIQLVHYSKRFSFGETLKFFCRVVLNHWAYS